ncbi:hypothetical protein [Mycolicibacterium sp.]|uniref:LppU/SCO3897 family protein n=1 Tax=Mycolicibacterium sp. TaxID=2320850 RepID=UPI0037C7CEA3
MTNYPPGPFPGPQQPPKKSRKLLWILLAVVVVGVAAIGIGGTILMRKVSDAIPTAGDCVSFHAPHETDLNQTARPLKADCASAEATFQVVTESESNPECADEYTVYQWMSKKEGKPAEVSKTWCMVPNLVDNYCYQLDAEDLAQVADTTCSRPGSLRVLKHIDAATDDGTCAALSPGAKTLSYTRPARTYCLVPVSK